jgi:hypothetical protein
LTECPPNTYIDNAKSTDRHPVAVLHKVNRMFLLPRGTPVVEGLASSSIAPSALLERLRTERLTGYCRCTFPSSVTILLFEEGRLICVAHQQGGRSFFALDAISASFDRLAAEGGVIDIYRLSSDLVTAVNGLLQGDVLYQGQELKLIDSRALLAKLRAQQFNGCLRTYAANRTALIFYRNGNAIGFFHDGSSDIETSVAESQRIAGMPGAKIDVLATRAGQSLGTYDLLEMINVEKVWEMTRARQQAELDRLAKQAQEAQQREAATHLAALGDDLKEIAAAYLGPLGRSLVEKELVALGGEGALLDDEATASFFAAVERSGRLLAGTSKTNEMVGTMRKEVAERRMRLTG